MHFVLGTSPSFLGMKPAIQDACTILVMLFCSMLFAFVLVRSGESNSNHITACIVPKGGATLGLTGTVVGFLGLNLRPRFCLR